MILRIKVLKHCQLISRKNTKKSKIQQTFLPTFLSINFSIIFENVENVFETGRRIDLFVEMTDHIRQERCKPKIIAINMKRNRDTDKSGRPSL